jgi:hypothetical protein
VVAGVRPAGLLRRDPHRVFATDVDADALHVAPGGDLFASESSRGGRLLRHDTNGRATVVGTDLDLIAGFALAPDGTIYVLHWPPPMTGGRINRITVLSPRSDERRARSPAGGYSQARANFHERDDQGLLRNPRFAGRVPLRDGRVVAGTFAALIDPATWEACQRIRSSKRRTVGNTAGAVTRGSPTCSADCSAVRSAVPR